MREMKDSGIPWIGEVPASWKVEMTSSIFHEHKEKNIGLQETNLLSLSYGHIKRKDIKSTEGLLPESFETYNIINSGDIVFRLTDLQNDKRSLRTGLCTERGIITSAYLTLRSICEQDSRFFHYLFHIYDICKVFYGLGDGVRQGMKYNDVRSILVCFPPLSEQKLIADYLDRKCGEIDELVLLQEKMIEELKSYKQSVITEAVTKGLNPNAPMKDSGIEWIGEIPEGWEINRLKSKSNKIFKGSGITKDDIVESGDTLCVRYGEIYSKYNYSFKNCLTRTNKSLVPSQQYFSYGDLLFAGTGELVEEIGKAITYLGKESCLAGGDIIVLKHNENPLFMSYALNSHCAQAQKSCNKAKLKVVHISADDISNIMMAFPPRAEQDDIANYLETLCTTIDALISLKKTKIEHLKDYKKSLIYEYVTGKKQVASADGNALPSA